MICSVLELSTSLPLTRIHILTNPLVLPPTVAAAIKKKAPDSLTVTTPLSCLMFFDASVEFIVTTLGLGSTASCSSVLEACRYDAAEAPPTEARSMTDMKIILKIAFISCLPLALDYAKRVSKGDRLAFPICGTNKDLGELPPDGAYTNSDQVVIAMDMPPKATLRRWR